MLLMISTLNIMLFNIDIYIIIILNNNIFNIYFYFMFKFNELI